MAKAAVAEARAAGIELPKNAQGMAASAIARGADPASLFAAKVTGEIDEPSAGDQDLAETSTPDANGDAVPVDLVTTTYVEAQAATGPALTAEETALALLDNGG